MSLCNNLNYLPHFKLFGIVVKKCHEANEINKYRKYLEKFQSLAKVGFFYSLDFFDDQISPFGCLDAM